MGYDGLPSTLFAIKSVSEHKGFVYFAELLLLEGLLGDDWIVLIGGKRSIRDIPRGKG